jgi:hypothetical protein
LGERERYVYRVIDRWERKEKKERGIGERGGERGRKREMREGGDNKLNSLRQRIVFFSWIVSLDDASHSFIPNKLQKVSFCQNLFCKPVASTINVLRS